MNDTATEPTTTKGLKAKKALMDAGIPMIAEKGVNGFSIGELCKAANLNRTSFYTYFDSIDELVWALWQREALMFHERFRVPHVGLVPGAMTLCINILGMFEIGRENIVWNKFSMQLFASNPNIRSAWTKAVAVDVAAAVEDGLFRLDRREQDAFTQLAIGAIFSTALNLNRETAREEASWEVVEQLFRAAKIEDGQFRDIRQAISVGTTSAGATV